VSDQLRHLVRPFSDVEPPLDLHNRITARERELTVSGREPWHPPRVLVFAVAAAGVGLMLLALVIAAHSRSSAPGPANGPSHNGHSATNVPDCSNGDLAPTLEIRRPPARQNEGGFQATSHHRVLTIVVRNVSDRRCYGEPAFRLKILDRHGRTVGAWDDTGEWFRRYYGPGAAETFSLPTVYRCDRPGPFSAVAVVHGHHIRRNHLTLREITCP
jgi:hypothetical protein